MFVVAVWLRAVAGGVDGCVWLKGFFALRVVADAMSTVVTRVKQKLSMSVVPLIANPRTHTWITHTTNYTRETHGYPLF